MSPRPKNPPPDRRQEILDAALRAFADHGYEAATNAQIAREAGVTPAALYYYFPSKADLFRAAISDRKGVLMPDVQQMAEQLREMPPEIVLPMMLQMFAAFISEPRTQAVLKILLAEGPRNPDLIAIWQNAGIGAVAPVLMGYLQHQMELGRIRPMDPRLLTILLNGPLLMLTVFRDFLNVSLATGITNEDLLKQLLDGVLAALIIRKEE